MHRCIIGGAVALSLLCSSRAGASEASEVLPTPVAPTMSAVSPVLFDHICHTYGSRVVVSASAIPGGRETCLDRAVSEIGSRLAVSGIAGVPASDLAALAMLLSGGHEPMRDIAPEPSLTAEIEVLSRSETPTDLEAEQLADIGKGQEGFAQGVERLAELPLSERMVVTGDVTAGLQAASVQEASELTSVFGRARVNIVARAVPASSNEVLSEGYFFVQMIAAGGAFDASTVGGPSTLSAFNDVSTDRSAFNQDPSRGNLYLKKAFYQQQVNLSERSSVLARVGAISMTDFFDTSEFANNEARQFLNAAFVNSAAFKAGVGAPGFMAEYRRQVDLPWADTIALKTGYAVTSNSRAFTSPVWTTEVEVQSELGGRSGAYRIGGTLGNVPETGRLTGVHAGIDQWLTGNLGVFVRYGQSNSGPGSILLGPVLRSYSAGAQWRLGDDLERVSAWGIAFGQAFPIASAEATVSERVIESYYRRQFTRNLSLTPSGQLILGAGGQAERGTHVVGSLRVSVGF